MGNVRWIWPLFVIALLILAPWWIHRTRPTLELDLAVVDKTVPFQNRIEHRSLFWLLNHFKVRDGENRPYRADSDYFGATPGVNAGDPPVRVSSLTVSAVAGADMVYLADTYGIYEEDLASGEPVAALERSPKIYGGLEPEEAVAAADAVREGKILVAEFNAFASPTGADARATMEQALGVRWTRWIGRYFPRLEEHGDVPEWMRRNYERIHRKPWRLRGPGYVLCRDDEWIEVLRVGEESERIGLVIDRNEPVDDLLDTAGDGVPYPYWFDVVEREPETAQLASFRWKLRPAGYRRLEALGLPRSFPAVTRRTAPEGGEAYYFAGDFADNPMSDVEVPFAGYATLRRYAERLKIAPSETAFFWRFYLPMMQNLLERHARPQED